MDPGAVEWLRAELLHALATEVGIAELPDRVEFRLLAMERRV